MIWVGTSMEPPPMAVMQKINLPSQWFGNRPSKRGHREWERARFLEYTSNIWVSELVSSWIAAHWTIQTSVLLINLKFGLERICLLLELSDFLLISSFGVFLFMRLGNRNFCPDVNWRPNPQYGRSNLMTRSLQPVLWQYIALISCDMDSLHIWWGNDIAPYKSP